MIQKHRGKDIETSARLDGLAPNWPFDALPVDAMIPALEAENSRSHKPAANNSRAVAGCDTTTSLKVERDQALGLNPSPFLGRTQAEMLGHRISHPQHVEHLIRTIGLLDRDHALLREVFEGHFDFRFEDVAGSRNSSAPQLDEKRGRVERSSGQSVNGDSHES